MFFLLQCHPLFLTKHDNDTAWNVFQKCFVHHNNSLQENVLVLQACFRSITRFFRRIYSDYWDIGHTLIFDASLKFVALRFLRPWVGFLICILVYSERPSTQWGVYVSHIRMTFPPFCRFSLPFWVTSFTTAVSYLCSGNYRTETQMRQLKGP